MFYILQDDSTVPLFDTTTIHAEGAAFLSLNSLEISKNTEVSDYID